MRRQCAPALHAGPTVRSEADHAVLWTKDIFEADNLKIEYNFTRIDTTTLPGTVNIIYILAQGGAGKPFVGSVSGCQMEHTRHRCLTNLVGNLVAELIAYNITPKKPALNLEIIDLNEINKVA